MQVQFQSNVSEPLQQMQTLNISPSLNAAASPGVKEMKAAYEVC